MTRAPSARARRDAMAPPKENPAKRRGASPGKRLVEQPLDQVQVLGARHLPRHRRRCAVRRMVERVHGEALGERVHVPRPVLPPAHAAVEEHHVGPASLRAHRHRRSIVVRGHRPPMIRHVGFVLRSRRLPGSPATSTTRGATMRPNRIKQMWREGQCVVAGLAVGAQRLHRGGDGAPGLRRALRRHAARPDRLQRPVADAPGDLPDRHGAGRARALERARDHHAVARRRARTASSCR